VTSLVWHSASVWSYRCYYCWFCKSCPYEENSKIIVSYLVNRWEASWVWGANVSGSFPHHILFPVLLGWGVWMV